MMRLYRESHDDAAQWLLARYDSLPSKFLFELSRRFLRLDAGRDGKEADAALYWYAVAEIRLRYDAGRCIHRPPAADRFAEGALTAVRPPYELRSYIKEHRAAYGRAGLQALRTVGLFAGSAVPWTHCQFGHLPKGRFRPSRVEPPPPETYLRPRNEWTAIRAALVTEYTAFYQSQLGDHSDPVRIVSGYWARRVEAQNMTYAFAWSNSNLLLYRAESTDGKRPVVLKAWSTEYGRAHAGPPDGAWVCAGSDRFLHLKKTDPKGPRPYTVTAFDYADRHWEPAPENTISLARWPSRVDDSGYVGQQYPSRMSRIWINPFDCRATDAGELTSRIGHRMLSPLRTGHGYLTFAVTPRPKLVRGPKPIYEQQPPVDGPTVLHFASVAADGSALPIDLPAGFGACVRYAAYRQAYFVTPCYRPKKWREEHRELLAQCIPSWWFDPDAGATQRHCEPHGAMAGLDYDQWPWRDGMIRVVRNRTTAAGAVPGGIYLQKDGGEFGKIFEAWIGVVRMSPDGCRLAVVSRRSKSPDNQLHVIELCWGPSTDARGRATPISSFSPR